MLAQAATATRELAAADALLAIEARGTADALDRGRVAAQSELLAIKESEQFTQRFEAAQRATAVAVQALTDDLDRQAATVRGSLITSMNAAAAAYEASTAAAAAAARSSQPASGISDGAGNYVAHASRL